MTAHKIESTVESYSKQMHAGVFFLAILSYGTKLDDEMVVLGTDCLQVEISNLVRFFYAPACPSLKGIPKIFLINACSSTRLDQYHARLKAPSSGDIDARAHDVLASAGDIVIVYSSTKGNTGRGSHFAQEFINATVAAEPAASFAEIMHEVKQNMSDKSGQQTVEVLDGLSRTQEYHITR